MDDLRLVWQGEVVGALIQARPDMWYLEGKWLSENTQLSSQFEHLASLLDLRAVMQSVAEGIGVVLLENEVQLPAVVMSLAQGTLFVRLITSR